MPKKTKRKARKLVTGYLERISSDVFSGFPDVLKELVGGQHGLYALYKGDRLYYVGLATNLKSRINQHLRDKHKGNWERFSLYQVQKVDHIKELESLVMRIADPEGNASIGRLKHAKDLKRQLDRIIKKEQDKIRRGITGKKSKGLKKSQNPRKSRKPKETSKGKRAGIEPALRGYVKRKFRLRATYKGKEYRAKARPSGRIIYNGVSYSSPTAAAKAIIGKAINGWNFWKFRDKDGNWVNLDKMRK